MYLDGFGDQHCTPSHVMIRQDAACQVIGVGGCAVHKIENFCAIFTTASDGGNSCELIVFHLPTACVLRGY